MRGCCFNWLRTVAVLVLLVGFNLDARDAKAQAVVGGPYSSSYRVSDYLVLQGSTA